MAETARSTEYTTTASNLYMAFELSSKKWNLGFTIGMAQRPRERTIHAGDLGALQQEIPEAKVRFGLAETAPVQSCYEAGRDTFWLHRCLSSLGIASLVVDSTSIEVGRRKKHRKTDRLDLERLLNRLIRHHNGEAKVWSVVRVPSAEAEDNRQLHRELLSLKDERTRHINRIKGLLVGQGIRLAVGNRFPERLSSLRLWDGTELPAGLRTRLEREYARLCLVTEQIALLEATRQKAIRYSTDPAMAQVRQLLRLRCISEGSAWLYVMESFGWREIRNRRQLGALAGLTPTLSDSGDSEHEQGISKAGNEYVRTMAVEIAWAWLRYQPDSALSCWYWERFGQGGQRASRIGIVALARKLLVALWRYLETGDIPAAPN